MKHTPLISLALVLAAGAASATTANYSDFTSTAGLTLNGDAAQAGNALRLVPNLMTQAGSTFLTTAVPLTAATGFSTAFKFNVNTNAGDPTDGFAFLLQADSMGASALGAAGQGLGYVGLAPSVAVVFRGRNPNLIGVITGGIDPADLAVPFQPAGFYTSTEGAFYNQDEFAWIDYDPGTTQLSVFLSTTNTKPGSAVMTTTVDVFDTLGAQAFVGFSAGNGGATGNQDILSWSFTSAVPEPTTAGMLLLGIAALGWMRRRGPASAA